MKHSCTFACFPSVFLFVFLTDVVNRRKRRGCAIPFNSCALDNKDMGNKNDDTFSDHKPQWKYNKMGDRRC